MKRFLAYAQDLGSEEQTLWEQAGFDLVTDEEAAILREDGVTIDLALLDDLSSSLEQLDPKAFVAPMREIQTTPAQWSRKYELRLYGTSPQGWLIGTKAEAPLPDDWGNLLDEKNVAAFAESLYYYLLRDVFRETAEWCGHMSSVVRRL